MHGGGCSGKTRKLRLKGANAESCWILACAFADGSAIELSASGAKPPSVWAAGTAKFNFLSSDRDEQHGFLRVALVTDAKQRCRVLEMVPTPKRRAAQILFDVVSLSDASRRFSCL